MGTQTKRRFKAEDQVDSSSKDPAAKRQRKKRTFVRRNCKGMCYTGPVLTAEDYKWEGGPAQPPSPRSIPTFTDQDVAEKSSSRVRSTAAPRGQKSSSKSKAAPQQQAAVKELSAQDAVQQYLAACRLVEPMPVQSRSVLPHASCPAP